MTSASGPGHLMKSSFFRTYFIFLEVFPETRSYSTPPYKSLPESNILHSATWGYKKENLLKSALLFSNPGSIFLSQMYLNLHNTSANLLYLHIQQTSILFFLIFALSLSLSLSVTLLISLLFSLLGIFFFFLVISITPALIWNTEPFEDYEGSDNGRGNERGRKLFWLHVVVSVRVPLERHVSASH